MAKASEAVHGRISMMRATTVLAVLGIISCSTSSHGQPLDLQATCAAQAKKAFDDWESKFQKGADAAGEKYKTVSRNYQSYYNSKLNKCFVLVETNRMLGEDSITSVYLADPYERRTYADYLWIWRENKGYSETPPSKCELVPSLREKRDCKTREEFDAFVAGYMEE
jgi:hypothetical protein